MYKVLITDDEPMIREGLRTLNRLGAAWISSCRYSGKWQGRDSKIQPVQSGSHVCRYTDAGNERVGAY